MNTLTLFTEYQGKLADVIRELNNYSQSMWQDDDAKKRGLKAKDELGELGKKLAERLQEQEEELERWRAYGNDTARLPSTHGFSVDAWVQTYKKEKTNVELIQSNSDKADEEGINRGSQDS